jgi:sulfofructosephosphate aldolase
VPSTDPFDPSAIAAADGTFRMLAIDQRESLRTLLVSAGQPSADSDLTAFKVAVARTLSPAATGMLIDRDYGLDAVVAAGALGEGCGLIVAVDRLIQKPGAALTWSELDHAAMTPALRAAGAVACKFLVVWRPDDPVGPRQAMVRTFIDGCRTLGLAWPMDRQSTPPSWPRPVSSGRASLTSTRPMSRPMAWAPLPRSRRAARS